MRVHRCTWLGCTPVLSSSLATMSVITILDSARHSLWVMGAGSSGMRSRAAPAALVTASPAQAAGCARVLTGGVSMHCHKQQGYGRREAVCLAQHVAAHLPAGAVGVRINLRPACY